MADTIYDVREMSCKYFSEETGYCMHPSQKFTRCGFYKGNRFKECRLWEEKPPEKPIP
jgi:Fe-S-cluster containining protein